VGARTSLWVFFLLVNAAALSLAGSLPTTGNQVASECITTKSSAFHSMQPCVWCSPSGECSSPIDLPSPTQRLIWESQQAVARGDMKTAIARMEAAVSRANRIAAGEGPWAHLAELYCVQANREKSATVAAALRRKGLNLLREHRCADRMRESLSCALPDWRNESSRETKPRSSRSVDDKSPNPRAWGYVPSPELTPMCMIAYCGAGFQNDEDGEPRSMAYDFLYFPFPEQDGLDEDEATVGHIQDVLMKRQRLAASAEKWCRTGAGGSP
jgi:hypothetical protein